MKIEAALGEAKFSLALEEGVNPFILSWLERVLPWTTPVHPSRIAGNQFYVNTDLVFRPDSAGTDVNHIEPGTWIFWPNRQLLECITGKINAEDTPVQVVGRTEGGLDALLAAAERVKAGAKLSLRLAWPQPHSGVPEQAERPAAFDERRILRAVRSLVGAMWSDQPGFVAEIAGRQGPMQPAGGLLMLEAIGARHQEMLWHVFARQDEFERQSIADALDMVLMSLVEQIQQTLAPASHPFEPVLELCGFAEHLSEVGLGEALADGIRICGSISHWADLHIAWPQLSEAQSHAMAST